MRLAQQIYQSTPGIEYATKFPTYPTEIREELSLIHRIVESNFKREFYRNHKTQKHKWTMVQRQHEDLLTEYEEKYGELELKM